MWVTRKELYGLGANRVGVATTPVLMSQRKTAGAADTDSPTWILFFPRPSPVQKPEDQEQIHVAPWGSAGHLEEWRMFEGTRGCDIHPHYFPSEMLLFLN